MSRARLAAGAAIALAVAAAVALVLQSHSQPKAAGDTGVPAGYTTASVQRRTLTERAEVDGTLGYGTELDIYDRLSGTFTWLPAVGDVIRRGGTLFKIDNEPVILMYGSVPAYRALKEGVAEGPDVAELNANLARLGYDPYGAIGGGDHFGAATAAAVRRWQKARGLPQTGEVELGRIVFNSGARRITAVHKALGDDPPPASSADNGSKDPTKHPAAEEEDAAKEEEASKAKDKEREKEKDKAKEEEATKESPAANEGEESAGGGGAPVLVLSATATRQVVQLQVKATEQRLARVGESAPVTLPNGDVVHGRITAVGTVATESSESENNGNNGNNGGGGSGENAKIAVTLALTHAVARLDKAPVSVELVKSVRRGVLAVPATALVATAGGGYAVEALEGSRRVSVAVTPGMFANGYVEVEGAGIHAGMTVIEPE